MQVKILSFLGLLLLGLLLVLAMAYPTMWAWNEFVPKVFGLTKINFWDAFWLNMLITIFRGTSTNSKK